MPSPFPVSASKSGHGSVHLTLLPPATPTFSTLSYAYPLKLFPSNPHTIPTPGTLGLTSPNFTCISPAHQQPRASRYSPATVPLLFFLTYGGGLLPHDTISLNLTLDPSTRLTITTQGSTKIFASAPLPPGSPQPIARQSLHVRIGRNSALWLAPDPIQPFAASAFEQDQVFDVDRGGSLGIVDWVSEGRRARGESWSLRGYSGKNEVWDVYAEGGNEGCPGENRDGKRRLLLRDAVVLEGAGMKERMDGMGVFGTLLLRGPLFESLATFFVEEFASLPRIGGRDWGFGSAGEKREASKRERWRKDRIESEKRDGVLWTACRVRGCAVVKFTAREVEGARAWLGRMLREDGTVARECGEGGLMFVR